MTLGDKLSKLRRENNFTQEQLADVLGVSRQAISKWESDAAYPETDKLIRICRFFHCSTDYLLLEDENCVGNQSIPAGRCLPENQLLMDEVITYMDTLFSRQRKNRKLDALREKLLGQMTGDINDLILQGTDETDALRKAKENIAEEVRLAGEYQLTDLQDYFVQCSFSVLLNCTLFWIFSLPLLFVKYAPICFAGLAFTLVSGVCYMFQNQKSKKRSISALVSIPESRRRKKIVWMLWGVFFAVAVMAKAAALFGSHLWFGRPVEITGPSSVINIALHIYVPLLTVFFPITVGNFTKILLTHDKEV